MRTTLFGYDITARLHVSERSTVYRAQRCSDGLAVVLKVVEGNDAGVAIRITALRHEYMLLGTLDGEGCVRSYDLAEDQGRWALVMEDIGGASLDLLGLAGKLSLADFLVLAERLAGIVHSIHQRRIVHKDINPSNFVMNPETGRMALIDFGIATVLSEEHTLFESPRGLEGTLAYMSPEQTGRMNRPVDYRSDYYSLGVTLYELLTGTRPFTSEDALELVHSHIARQPPSPLEQDSTLPQVVASILLKLLAKNADERYQSMGGLLADLRECQEQLRRKGLVDDFPLARYEGATRFRLSQKLYGRDAEGEQLVAAFERATQGAVLMTVCGYSGIGKSALIQEVYRPLTRHRGYFVSGKFDQFHNHVPYTALIQAFESLLLQVLTENEERLTMWRQRLRAVLGGNVQVLVEACPSLELVLGRQAEVQTLPPVEARTRFTQVVVSFVSALATPEHPLCLFFDDLQWADVDSLKLLVEVLRSSGDLPLFIIGSYRDNEVSDAHPLRLALQELKEQGARLESLVLSPLLPEHVRALVADTFSVSQEVAAPLAELLVSRTAGNPFFVRAFLSSLYADGLLESAPVGWRWDLERIRQRGITDNVVELMVDRIRRLPPRTQEILKWASCLGNSFDMEALGLASGRADGSAGRDLWDSVAEGLVIPLGKVHSALELSAATANMRCRFAHDRIQQAASSMMGAEELAGLHRAVGLRMLQFTPPEGRERALFDIVGHLNKAQALLKAPTEREELLQLNLLAARKAIKGAAGQRALGYVRSGLALLGDDMWEHRYALSRDFHLAGAEAAFLCSDLEALDAFSRRMLSCARDVLDELAIRKLEGQVLYSQQRLADSLRVYSEALRRLGFELPADPTAAVIAQEMEATAEALGSRSVESLRELPESEEPQALLAMELLNQLVLMTYSLVSNMHPVVICRLVQFSLRHGNTPASPMGYTFYGGLLASRGDVDRAYRFGRLALALADHFQNKVALSQTYLYASIQLIHWKAPLPELTNSFTDAYRYGLEAASPFNAACSATTVCINRLLAGSDLGALAMDMATYSDVVHKLRQQLVQNWHDTYRQTVLNLREDSPRPTVLAGPVYDEIQRVPMHQAAQDPSALFNYYFCKSLLCYLFGDAAGAAAAADTNEPNAAMFGNSIWATPLAFLGALYRLAVYEHATPAERERLLRVADVCRERLAGLLEHNPKTVAHKLALVEAERARVLGEDTTAREAYARAVELARQSGYLHEEALACERAARFHLHRGESRLALRLLRDARQGWTRWGAVAKVRSLEREFPALLPRVRSAELCGSTVTALAAEGDFNVLDLVSVLDASQALSMELDLDRLLVRLMLLLIETGGAEAGYMLMEHEGRWVVKASKMLGHGDVEVLRSIPLEDLQARGYRGLPAAVVYYVARTGEEVVLDDASASPRFGRDPYISAGRVKSVLCFPLPRHAGRSAVVYLENNLVEGAFTRSRVRILKLLSTQAVISLDNALLYNTLEQRVEERTHELKVKNDELATTLSRLRETQNRLIVQDRLAALGTMAAGIAHELRNPLNFINNFSEMSHEMVREAVGEVATLSSSNGARLVEPLHELLGDVENNLAKIHEHGKRMETIIRSMLQHSSSSMGVLEETNLNALLSNYLDFAQQGMKLKDPSLDIVFQRNFDPNLGPIRLMPQELSRVVINLVDNACYAVGAKRKSLGGAVFTPTIRVSTHDVGNVVEIRVHDNGTGIPESIWDKLFTPFFTTKKTGEGTGLGLSLSHEVIVKGHGGSMSFETTVGQFTEFIITLPKQVA